MTFTVARYTSRQVEIQGQFVGTVAEGYLAGLADDFVFSPTTLTVSGQADMVNQISCVRVTVDGEGLTDSINGDYPYEFIGTDGEPLEDLDVEVDSETVHVSFPIYAMAEIPLQVTLVAGGGASSANASYELSEDTILVAGSAQAVAAIQEEGALTIAAIDLATVRDGDQLHVSIPLADELTNISGFTEVTVTIHIDEGLETRTVETSNIDYINCPDGWTARILPGAQRGDSGHTRTGGIRDRGKRDRVRGSVRHSRGGWTIFRIGYGVSEQCGNSGSDRGHEQRL